MASTSKASVAAAPAAAKKTGAAKRAPSKSSAVKTSTTKSAGAKSPARKPAAPTTASKKGAQATTSAAPADTKATKAKKPKLVRDSFTIPKLEYVVLEALKLRAAKLTRPAKKSELLRAGIKALAALSDAAFLSALAQVPAIKTGRPSAEK